MQANCKVKNSFVRQPGVVLGSNREHIKILEIV